MLTYVFWMFQFINNSDYNSLDDGYLTLVQDQKTE